MKNSKKENKFIFKLIVVIIILILSSAIIKRIYTKILLKKTYNENFKIVKYMNGGLGFSGQAGRICLES